MSMYRLPAGALPCERGLRQLPLVQQVFGQLHLSTFHQKAMLPAGALQCERVSSSYLSIEQVFGLVSPTFDYSTGTATATPANCWI